MNERVAVQLEFRGILTGTIYAIRVYPSADGISIYWLDIP